VIRANERRKAVAGFPFRRLAFLGLLHLTLAFVGRASADVNSQPPPGKTPSTNTGTASYYAAKYHGRQTANGEIYDMHRLTAAHRTLPFGTVVKVTNLDNHRSVVVRVNDRGPFIDGRVIDLSWEAARTIGMVQSGLAPVKLEIQAADPTSVAMSR
jgi:rare lipoprotein A